MSEDDMQKLLDVAIVLNKLVISLDRIGAFQHTHGEEQGQKALSEFMGPSTFQELAQARHLIHEVLDAHDPACLERLEAKSEGGEIGYWDGPSWMQG